MPNLLPVLIIASAWATSVFLGTLPFLISLHSNLYYQVLCVCLIAPIFAIVFPVTLGLISVYFQKGIVKGKYPRELLHPVYFCRRVYGLCWTQVFYFKPLYSVILAIPAFKLIVFRLFGYKGNMNFTTYPDTWIRDLPLLDLGKGSYLANRATIGTNMALTDGTIFVQGITIGAKGLVGHLCMLAPGVKIGEAAEIGSGCAIGIKVRIKDRGNIKPHSTLNHGSVISENSSVGTMSYVGLRAVIGQNIHLPSGSNIPDGAVIQTQSDCDKYFSAESAELSKHRKMILNALEVPGSNE